jgi:hypothetical protein
MTTTTMAQELSHAEQNARAHVETICELFARHQEAMLTDDREVEQVEEEAREQVLSVEVRTDWHAPSVQSGPPTEGCLLLTTGGPALRLLIELDDDAEPCSVTLEHQDWGTPWTALCLAEGEEQALEWFAGLFWFGQAC